MYIFVLGNDTNGLSVLLVICLSQQQPIRSFVLYQRYNIVMNVDPIYFYFSSTCILLSSTIIPTVWYLCMYIFVPDNNLPDKIYCYWITVKYLIFIKLIVLSGTPEYIFVLYSYPNTQSLAIVHCWCPQINLFSHTHTQYLNISSDDNSFPKELASIMFW